MSLGLNVEVGLLTTLHQVPVTITVANNLINTFLLTIYTFPRNYLLARPELSLGGICQQFVKFCMSAGLTLA